MTDNLENDIELARRQLKEDLEKREKEAQQSIDKILSQESVEFCSRCNKKIEDRLEWAGRCLDKNCNRLICVSCWLSENKRYCSDHYEEALGKEKEGKKKTFFSPEAASLPTPTLSVDFTDEERETVTGLVNGYIDFIKQRLSNWGPDWNHEGWIDNAKPEVTGKGDNFEITIFSKHFLSKKPKLKVIVRPVYGKKSDDLDFILSTIKETGQNIYHLLVLIGDECDAGALEFVDTFNKQNASLFLIEPKKHLIYTDEKPLTKLYSIWVDQTKTPQKLKDLLRTLVKEKVSGRDTITTKSVSEAFGLSEQDAFIFLNSCKFLKHVEETDTYYFVS